MELKDIKDLVEDLVDLEQQKILQYVQVALSIITIEGEQFLECVKKKEPVKTLCQAYKRIFGKEPID